MSAIGEYVHYYKRNYERWGTHRNRTTPTPSWSETIADVKSIISKDRETQKLIAKAKSIEDSYNLIFYAKGNSADKNAAKFRAELEKSIQTAINKQFKNTAGKFDINKFAIEETALQAQLKAAIRETRDRVGKLNKEKDMTVIQLRNKVNQLLRLLEQKEFLSIEGLEKNLSTAKQELNEIKNKISSVTNLSLKASYSDVETINKIIEEYNRIPTLYEQNEMLFEWILPFVMLKTNQLGKKGILNALKSMGNKIKFDAPDLETKTNTQDINIKIGEIEIKTISSDNGSSIYITYSDRKKALPKLVSANPNKNYKSIELIPPQSLYDLLAANNIMNFANHYLNIISYTAKNSYSNSVILEANRILKVVLLNGNNNNTDKFIIINDTKERKVHVYSLKALINILQNNLMTPRSKYTGIVSINNDYKVAHKWEIEGVNARVQKIVNKLQRKKINATLNGKDINKYLSLLK